MKIERYSLFLKDSRLKTLPLTNNRQEYQSPYQNQSIQRKLKVFGVPPMSFKIHFLKLFHNIFHIINLDYKSKTPEIQMIILQQDYYLTIDFVMGTSQSYVKGGGSHAHVPVPLNSKIQLYRSSKKLGANSQSSRNSQNIAFDTKKHKIIEWDINSISQQGFDQVKYQIKKLPTRNKIDMSII